MYYVYILKSINSGRYYIGHTNNVEKRLYRHNQGQVLATKAYKPWVIMFKKEFKTRAEAMMYESYLKSLKSKKALDKIIIAG